MAKLDDDDLKSIKDLVEITFDEKIDEKELVTKDNIKHLPTKDEFYQKMDEVIGELKAVREELPILSHQLSNHDDRIEKVEEKLQIISSN